MFGFKQKKTTIQVHLAPKFTNDIRGGINDYLNCLVTKYIPELQGVVIQYSNIKVTKKPIPIKSESPYLHFHVSVEFIVYSPQIGQLCVGVVNKVSPDHIGCLLNGFFNASLAADQFSGNDYHWDHETHSWKTLDGTYSIGPGSIIKFSIIKYPLIYLD
jgi:DNA-directed RNA polymerase subunit E'/Rpb7